MKIALRLPVFSLLPLMLAAIAPAALMADTVTLKNGDHLTGTVVKLDGGKVTFKTAYADGIIIDMKQVTKLSLDTPIVAVIPKGNLNVTRIEQSDADFTLGASTGDVTVTALPTLRTISDEKAYEASLHPGWRQNWAGSANVGLALARGNSDTTTFSTGMAIARTTLNDKTSLYASTLYTRDGIAKTTSAENEAGGARYDHNLNPKMFGFATADFYADALQELNLRSIFGGGLGYHALKTPKQTLDLMGGLAYTRESYDATTDSVAYTNNYLALDLGEQYSLTLNKQTMFTEQFLIYPDMNNLGQYNFALNSTLSTKINNLLSWQTTISDHYVSNPPSSTKDNDFILTTGLGIALGKK